MGEHEQQGGHRYAKSDEELTGFFTAALGVKAQSYQGNGGGAFDSAALHDQRLKAMRAGGMAWFDRVGRTLAQMPPLTRELLTTVYTPHAWPTWLADALSTPWGGGSFVLVAASLPRAATAAQRETGVLEWMLSRGRGGASDGEAKSLTALFRNLRDDAEALRMPAIAMYDLLRVARCKAEARERWEGVSTEQRRADRQRRRDEAEQEALRSSAAQRVAVALTGAHEARLAEVCAVVGEALGVDRRAA